MNYDQGTNAEQRKGPKTILADFITWDSGTFTFTGEKYIPKGLPSFHDELAEPPDVESGDDNFNDKP